MTRASEDVAVTSSTPFFSRLTAAEQEEVLEAALAHAGRRLAGDAFVLVIHDDDLTPCVFLHVPDVKDEATDPFRFTIMFWNILKEGYIFQHFLGIRVHGARQRGDGKAVSWKKEIMTG